MRPFEYSAPQTLAEATALLGREARPLAGGTDLLTLMKADVFAPGRLVAVRRLLPDAIEEGADGLTIGAGATLAAIETDAQVAGRYGALAQAAAAAASLQLRHVATLGGNLLQRPRCWYFRHPRIDCWLKGGATCPARDGENRQHALFGGGPCVAVHPSDLATALAAFDAELLVRGATQERVTLLERFFALPEEARRTETTLADDELVVAVRLPPPPAGTRSAYLKAMDRRAFSFALVGVAAAVRIDGGRIAHARVVLGGVAPIPWRAHAAERALLGAEPGAAVLQQAAAAALEGAAPLRLNAWKIPLARTLVARVLQGLTDTA